MATTAVDEFFVELNMEVSPFVSTAKNRKLSFTLKDLNTAPKPPKTAVGRKLTDNTATLTVAPGEERKITINLSNDWDWTFSDDPMTVRLGDTRHYTVINKGEKSITILCKPTNTDPKVGQDDKLDLSVWLAQHPGRDVLVTIDPVTENPPPTHGLEDWEKIIEASGVALPIA